MYISLDNCTLLLNVVADNNYSAEKIHPLCFHMHILPTHTPFSPLSSLSLHVVVEGIDIVHLDSLSINWTNTEQFRSCDWLKSVQTLIQKKVINSQIWALFEKMLLSKNIVSSIMGFESYMTSYIKKNISTRTSEAQLSKIT